MPMTSQLNLRKAIEVEIPSLPTSKDSTFSKAEKYVWFCDKENYNPEDLEEVLIFPSVEVPPGPRVVRQVPAPDDRNVLDDQADISMGCPAKQTQSIYIFQRSRGGLQLIMGWLHIGWQCMHGCGLVGVGCLIWLPDLGWCW